MRARDKPQGTHAWKRGAEEDVDWLRGEKRGVENVEQKTWSRKRECSELSLSLLDNTTMISDAA